MVFYDAVSEHWFSLLHRGGIDIAYGLIGQATPERDNLGDWKVEDTRPVPNRIKMHTPETDSTFSNRL